MHHAQKHRIIRGRILLNVDAPKSDKLFGQYHTAWRRPDSDTWAFYFRGDGSLRPSWYAWTSGCELRDQSSKEEALNFKS